MRPYHIVLLFPVGFSSLAVGQACAPGWADIFRHNGLGSTQYLEVFDAGAGPGLYACGNLSTAGDFRSGVARWDGLGWLELPGPFNSSPFRLRAVELGQGPRLVVGGDFTAIGALAANGIAAWDGQAWTGLGAGFDGGVRAIAMHDDGFGPALYVGGSFQASGGVACLRVARWNGTQWLQVGPGLASTVNCLVSHTSQIGTHLYAGGSFPGGIARFTGSQWTPVGSIGDPTVACAASFEGQLYIGASGQLRFVVWDGTTWNIAGGNVDGEVREMRVDTSAVQPRLRIVGTFQHVDSQGSQIPSRGIAQWTGAGWEPFPDAGSLSTAVRAPDGDIYVGGSFEQIWNYQSSGVARFVNGGWDPMTGNTVDGSVRTMIVHDDGQGRSLFAFGFINWADGSASRPGAKWTGTEWISLGTALAGVPTAAAALSGPDGGLFLGGDLFELGGVQHRGIVRWDGNGWSEIPGESNAGVRAMAAYDDGSGPAVYVAGNFTQFSGASASVVRWTGSQWQTVGGPLGGIIHDLLPFDDGSGTRLYAGGSIGQATSVGLIAWDGTSWSSIPGQDGGITTLCVHDDGQGVALFAGGTFGAFPGTPNAERVARWDGQQWSALGLGIGPTIVRKLVSFDDGFGGALYAIGDFNSASLAPVRRVARWKDSVWTDVMSGLGPNNGVDAWDAAVFDDNAGINHLYIGGDFKSAGSIPSWHVARLNGCPQLCYANCDASTTAPVLNVADFTCFLQQFAAGDPYANCDQSTITPVLNVADFTCFLQSFAGGCP